MNFFKSLIAGGAFVIGYQPGEDNDFRLHLQAGGFQGDLQMFFKRPDLVEDVHHLPPPYRAGPKHGLAQTIRGEK